MIKTNKVVKNEGQEVAPKNETPVVNENVKSSGNENVKYPEVASSGKYIAIKVGSGYAVYNPDGARVSEVMLMDEANEIVKAQNLAAHLK